MFAVVLVGGFGTRLRPLTLDVPKPVLPIGHDPMIVTLVDRLGQSGVTDVVLALGFQPEPFKAAFPNDQRGGVTVHYATEPEPLDTAGAIAFAARALDIGDTFLVLNGDIVTDLDYARLVDAHRAGDAAATLHLTPVADPSAYGVVEIDADGNVLRFVEKPQPGETDSNLINAGTYVMEPRVLDLIPAGERVSVERDTFPRLVTDRSLRGVSTDDYWIDTGRPETFLAANLDLLTGTRSVTIEPIAPGATVSDESTIVDSVIGHAATVGVGATVRESVLLPGARVLDGATISGSLVAGTVGEGVTVTDSVIGATATVTADVTAQRVPDVDRP